MTVSKNKGGRPKSDDKRCIKVAVRLRASEYKLLLELEQTVGVERSELIRQRVLDKANVTVINAKELIAGVQQIGAELGRSGNNINQLARYANILQKKGMLSPAVLERFNFLLADHSALSVSLQEALRKVIRLLRS